MTTPLSRRYTPQIQNAALLSMITLVSFTGCVIDQDEADSQSQPPEISCLAAPMCGPDQEEVDRCPEEGDLPCQEVTMCDQTIYCAESDSACVPDPVVCSGSSTIVDSCEGASGPCYSVETGCGLVFCAEEAFCDEEPPTCDSYQYEVDSCEDSLCFEYSTCSGTVFCVEDGFRCEVPPPECPSDTIEVESCADVEGECFLLLENDECYATIYCASPEIACTGLPTCAPGEVGSREPCEDGEELCHIANECGHTLYCRPDTETEIVELNACEPASTLPTDGFDMNDAFIDGDDLVLSVSYGGGCEEHIFSGCFSHFTETEPFMANVSIGHDAQGDACRGIMSEERRFSLEILKVIYQAAFGIESGVITVNLEGAPAPLEYEFN